MRESFQFDDATTRRLEVLYMSPDAVRRRSEVVRLLELRSAERVLDIGCGPGFLAAELATAVGPGGSVRGIDSSEAMVQTARLRCASQPWVSIERGDAETLAFPDAAFDVAVSVQVHEYVKEIEGALRELCRVLRPGGRALIVDTDWDSIVWRSSDAERMARILAAFDEHLAHPHLPRELAPLLRRAGLVPQQFEVLVQLNPMLEPNTYSYGMIDLIQRFVAGRRGVSRAEADAWAEDLRERGRSGEYFFSLNQYVFLATKP